MNKFPNITIPTVRRIFPKIDLGFKRKQTKIKKDDLETICTEREYTNELVFRKTAKHDIYLTSCTSKKDLNVSYEHYDDQNYDIKACKFTLDPEQCKTLAWFLNKKMGITQTNIDEFELELQMQKHLEETSEQ